MAQQMLSIMNAALLARGFEEIVNHEDGSDEWRLLSRNWPTIVERELEDGRYAFSRCEHVLVSRQPGAYGFEDAYILPAGVICVRNVRHILPDGDVEALWSQDATRVFVNHNAGVRIEGFTVPDAGFWGANFTMGIQKRLEAVLMRSIEDPRSAAEADGEAEIAFQRARTLSSKARTPSPAYRRGRYAEARFGRG
jgi:hypothetical protein